MPPLIELLHSIWSYPKAWNSCEDQWSWGQRYQREGGQPSPGINSLPSPGVREVVCYNWAIFTLPKALHIILTWVMVPWWISGIWGFIEGSALTCATLWGPTPYDNHSGEGDDGSGVEDQKGMGAIYPEPHLYRYLTSKLNLLIIVFTTVSVRKYSSEIWTANWTNRSPFQQWQVTILWQYDTTLSRDR